MKSDRPNGPNPKKAKMKPTNEVVCAVIDHGLFVPVAQKLSEQFKHVYYWCDSDRAFPTIREGIIGDGISGVERVDDFWKIKSQCDLFVFPDIGYAGLQNELISQGFPVWGSRQCDKLETSRKKFLETIESIGLAVPRYVQIRGLTKLREHLRDKENKFIKISKWRADVETWHWQNWEQDEHTLDYYAFKLGPAKELIVFYVMDPIDTKIEDGIDTFCIDGKLPETCFHAMERKDKALIGAVTKFDSISPKMREIAERFAPVLNPYRNFFSTEVRITEDASYFIDPTLRAGSPPSQVMTELYDNLGDIIWRGAHGDIVEPVPIAEFAGQVMIQSSGDPEEWTVAKIPDEIKQWVKVGHCGEIDGRIVSPPDYCHSNDFGWLVAIGDSIEDVIEKLKEYTEQLPDGLTADCSAFAHLIAEMDEAEEHGVEITTQLLPEPAVALE
jgi:hypothetical protein